MTSIVEKKFLRLFMFIHQLSLPVVREFLLSNTTSSSEGDDNKFHDFLNTNMHDLYHLYMIVRCCQCSTRPNVPKRPFRITKEQFEKLYKFGQSQTNHFLRGSSGVTQYCLCCISVNTNCTIRHLDMTLIVNVIKHCVKMQNNEEMWLNMIQHVRNRICHVVNISEFTENKVDVAWNDVEVSVLSLASKIPPFPRYKDSIEMQIKLIKEIEYGWNSVKPLMELMQAELNHSINNILHVEMEQLESYFNTKVDQLEKQLDNSEKEIKGAISKSTNTMLNSHINLEARIERCSTENIDCIKDVQCDLAIQSRDIKRILDCTEDGTKHIVQTVKETLEHKFNELTFIIECTKTSSNEHTKVQHGHIKVQKETTCSKDEATLSTETKHTKRVCITIATPGFMEEEKDKIIKSIQKSISSISVWAPFEIDFVIDGSIIIGTIVPDNIVENKKIFNNSIREFLDKMINICSIDSSKPLSIKVKVIILDTQNQGVRVLIDDHTKMESRSIGIQCTPELVDKQCGPSLMKLIEPRTIEETRTAYDNSDNSSTNSDSTPSIIGTRRQSHATPDNSSDDLTTLGSSPLDTITMNSSFVQMNVREGAEKNISQSYVQISTGDGQNVMKGIDHQHKEGHELFLISRFEQMKEVFVETKRYREARSILLENHYELLTGSSGEGKSFIAMKLIHEQIQQGHRFKEITQNTDFYEFHKCEKMVFLIDDAFQFDNQENQWLVLEIETFIEEEIQNKSNYLIITSRKLPFSQIKEKMKKSWLLEGKCVIDFGNGELELTKEEKSLIVLKYISKFKPNDTNNFVKSGKAHEIAEIDCAGFANCVYLFVRNHFWFNTGLDFFKHHLAIVRKELDNLKEKDPDVYLLLIYLLLKGGRIKGSSLDDCDKDDGILSILQKIYFYPKPSYCSILNSALQRVEYAFVSRVHSSGTITFRHDCIVEAICMSFSKILPRDAIMHVPFEFISKRMRTEDYQTDIHDRIIISGDRYDNLAKRFIEELKMGNIKSICEHPACNNEKFVDQFIENLNKSNVSVIIEITERACGSTLNGSLLYWSASCGAEILCRKILESDIYSIVTDKFWLRTQASVALVPSCWYGFRWGVIEQLLKLGADINSSIHSERSFQTYTSDFLAVHDPKGLTPIQAVVGGTNNNKSRYVQDLINKGCQFQDRRKMQRPLILAVKEGNKQLVEVLLKNGVNINAVDMRNTSAIEFAIELNQIEIAGLLLDRIITQKCLPVFCRPKTMEMMRLFETHIDLQAKDEEGRSLLHHAEDSKLVEFLLSNGLSVNVLDNNKRTPLYYATSEEVVLTLLKHGGSLLVDNMMGNTFFHIHKNVKVIGNVLEKLESNVIHKYINAKNNCGQPPIFVAKNDVLDCLLRNGANVNIKCSCVAQRQLSSEMYIEGCAETSAREHFVKNYINMEKVSNTTRSMESCLSDNHDEKRINFYDDNVTFENSDHLPQTDITGAMMLAFEGKLSLNLLELFLKHDYDITLKDGNGQTILHYVMLPKRYLKDVNSLLELIFNHARLELNQNGGDLSINNLVNHQNALGNTALHFACSCCCLNKLTSGRLDVVKKLLQFGANPNIRNLRSETALHRLMQCPCCPKLEILMSLHELSDYQSDDETLGHLFRSYQTKVIKQEALSDCLDVVQYLLRERKSVNSLSIFNKMIEFETNVNILVPILCAEGLKLKDTERKILYDLCLKKQHRNSTLLLLFMHPYCMTSENKSVLTPIDVYDTFSYCTRKLADSISVIKALEKLLHIGLDVNHEIENGTCLLSWTVKHAHTDNKSKILEFLLQNGATTKQQDLIRDCLASNGDDACTLDCIEILLEHGIKFYDGSPLICALNSANLRPKTIEFIINHPDTNLHQMDEENKKAFYYLLKQFSQSKQNEVIFPLFRCLIQKLNINRPFTDGSLAFTLALKFPNIPESVVFEIAQHMSDINSKDSIGRSPLYNIILYYQGYDELEIVKRMIKLGADMNFQTVDQNGRNFLHHLVSRMKYDTVKILLFYLSKVPENKKEENINFRDYENDTALHIASSFNISDPKHDLYGCASLRIPVVRILLANGAYKNATDKENQTALHILVKCYVHCVEKEKLESHIHHIHPIIELVNLLVESGIDLTIQDSNGKTALQYLQDDYEELILLRKVITKEVKPEVLILKSTRESHFDV